MLHDYLKNGGQTIIIYAMLMGALSAGMEVRAETPKPTCEQTLKACDLYVGALENETKELKKHVDEQDFEIARLTSQLKPTPWYWYVVGGAAAAIVTGQVIK